MCLIATDSQRRTKEFCICFRFFIEVLGLAKDKCWLNSPPLGKSWSVQTPSHEMNGNPYMRTQARVT